MEIVVNGDQMSVDGPVGVADLLSRLGLPDSGVAVAIDGVVRPKARWDEPVTDGAVVDVLTAVQGG